MTMLPAAMADECPVCGANHDALADEFWRCPTHGHQLHLDGIKDDYGIYTCPGHRCRYQRAAPRPRKGHAMTMTEPTSAALAIRGGQDFWDAKQIAALTQLGIKDASNADLAVYLHYCQKTGLDPFSRQIYMLARRTRSPGGEWETRQTIQIGIDGYRIIASRAARRDGVAISYGETLWYDGDGRAYPVWTRTDPPAAASVTVFRGKDAFPGVARFASFVPVKDGKPTGQWATMPDHMIAKCAEAQALRRAFPHDLAGTETTDETAHERITPWAEQQIPPPPPAVTPAPAPRKPRQKRQQAAADGSAALRAQIGEQFNRLGIEDDEERFTYVAELAGLPEDAEPTGPIGDETLTRVLERITACGDVAQLSALLVNGDAPEDGDG